MWSKEVRKLTEKVKNRTKRRIEFVEMNLANVERALQPANLSELELEATALQGKLLREGPGRTARLD